MGPGLPGGGNREHDARANLERESGATIGPPTSDAQARKGAPTPARVWNQSGTMRRKCLHERRSLCGAADEQSVGRRAHRSFSLLSADRTNPPDHEPVTPDVGGSTTKVQWPAWKATSRFETW
jgi:hypothetical protein